MDPIEEMSGGLYAANEIPEEFHLEIAAVLCRWPEESHWPEMYLP